MVCDCQKPRRASFRTAGRRVLLCAVWQRRIHTRGGHTPRPVPLVLDAGRSAQLVQFSLQNDQLRREREIHFSSRVASRVIRANSYSGVRFMKTASSLYWSWARIGVAIALLAVAVPEAKAEGEGGGCSTAVGYACARVSVVYGKKCSLGSSGGCESCKQSSDPDDSCFYGASTDAALGYKPDNPEI